jgi:outer membrane scaffolding protein for murein synthesis (MipA/OmpV family)
MEAGAGAVTFPDYRGSDRTQTYGLPVPYFVYRGDFLKADRNGVRGRFFDSDRVELNVTMNASAPVDSKDNPTRQGMPDLKPTVEIGPSLDLTLWRAADKRAKLDFRLPLVTGVTIEGSPRSTGWQFSPGSISTCRIRPEWRAGTSAGRRPLFSDRKQHQYFYSVSQEFATAGRPRLRGAAATPARSSWSPCRSASLVGSAASSATTRCAARSSTTVRSVKRDSYLAGGIAIA